MDGRIVNRLEIHDTPIAGLRRIVSIRLGDARGHLARLFCAEELAQAGWTRPVAQANLTLTRTRGTVRGMHYQLPPDAEMKLVRCVRGEVWDVAVDLRHGSPTFLQWHAERLSADNMAALLIPEGCAHGFQALTDDVEMLYLHSMPFAPASERGIGALDPLVGIRWPLPIAAMSDRDRGFPPLSKDFQGVTLP